MSTTRASGFNYLGPERNFTRDGFATLAAMKAFDEDNLPPTFITVVDETKKAYIFSKSNTVDPVLGKWRELEGGSGNTRIENTLEASPNNTLVYVLADSKLYYKDELGEAHPIGGSSVTDGVLEL